MPIENRIEQLARLVLVIILIVTLGLISLPKTSGKKSHEISRKTDVSRMVAKPTQGGGLREGLVTRSERRAKAI